MSLPTNDKVFYVYVLRSLGSNKRYVGYSGKTPTEKLTEHNGGATRWTRYNRPLNLSTTSSSVIPERQGSEKNF
jgi:predicted GIY-YIG superfamily endonuclease